MNVTLLVRVHLHRWNTGKTTRRRRSKIKETISWSFIEYTEIHEQYTYKRPIYAFKFIAWYLAYTDVFWKAIFFQLLFKQSLNFWRLVPWRTHLQIEIWSAICLDFFLYISVIRFGMCAWVWLYLKLTIFNHNCHGSVLGFWTYQNGTEISKVFDDLICFSFFSIVF